MKEGIIYTGVPSSEELRSCSGIPTDERINQGRVAVIECVQNIPCNPCKDVCIFNAIELGEEITALPKIREDLCIGCARCVAMCPGQAIVVLNGNYSNTEATIDFPFEYLPMPKVGMIVDAVNRIGQPICKGRILRVTRTKENAQTAVVSMAIPKEYINIVRGMQRLLSEEMQDE